jgi:hypothetical protein
LSLNFIHLKPPFIRKNYFTRITHIIVGKMPAFKIRSPFIVVSMLIALLLVAVFATLTSVKASPTVPDGLLADPEEIAPHGAFDLALGGGTLGWTYLVGEFCFPPGTIGAIDLTTRVDDVLLEECGASPAGAVADDSYLYFAEWSHDEIQSISFTSGVTETLADAAGLIYHGALTIDAEYVYSAMKPASTAPSSPVAMSRI